MSSLKREAKLTTLLDATRNYRNEVHCVDIVEWDVVEWHRKKSIWRLLSDF